MKKLFIIIIAYNGGKKLKKAVESTKIILNSNKNSKLVIVDNASKDNSIEQIKKVSSFKLIQNKKNLGFAKAVNKGVKYAIKNGADKVLLFNQDAFLKNKNPSALLNNQNEIVSPIVIFKRNNRTIYDFGGRLNRLLMRPYHLEKKAKTEKTEVIDYVSGCCMLVAVSVFEKIGYLDERFFLYFEDVDFCLRASKAGFSIVVEPKVEIEHDLDDEKKRPMKAVYNLVKSHFFFINKWVEFPKGVIAYIYWLLISLKILLNKLIYDLSHRSH